MMEKMLIHLERFDTYQAEDALRLALTACCGLEGSETTVPAQALWENWVDNEGSDAWFTMVDWAGERLNAWHCFKYNALETAWKTDPQGQRIQDIIKAVLINLRQGINDNPQMLADAHMIQALAKEKHSFSFTQAIKELRSSGVDLPAEDSALTKHCAICAKCFEILVG